ncbi:GYDIA family GHMP kinase [Flavobacterium amniphilum]|uniref:GYDIA family GHMP kinase n=1 Tax=Flavobacterium amniphilum TaxID=1834035 RepID=UPI00202A0BC9|nr:GYDIA family GHMP kinase [Flavobacterium amniphilum]MCL9806521.1 GYDIA family GHMP kinase [Flavobacterium amniphilum]
MEQTFYSNGKLLITGEYVVLDGAIAFALPTKFGQYLKIDDSKNNSIKWTSYDSDGSIWFESTIPFESIINKETFKSDKVKTTLIEILHHAYLLNPDFLNSQGYTIKTELTFPKFWGLGTSSTLINNISQWLKIDAFTLLKNSFGGSGYDIACAQNNTPILYHLENGKPLITPVNFIPDYSNKIYFIYLNQKQNSREAIHNYYNKKGDINKVIPLINTITQQIVEAKEAKAFAKAIQNHEIEMSNVLETQTVQEALFPEFEGVVKSLGAWGGDFVLAISKENPTEYFNNKGYITVIPYSEMIL